MSEGTKLVCKEFGALIVILAALALAIFAPRIERSADDGSVVTEAGK
jgi:hypothetical protein